MCGDIHYLKMAKGIGAPKCCEMTHDNAFSFVSMPSMIFTKN